MEIITIQGDLPLEKIPDLNNKWWEYWKEYWKNKNTSKPFPKDYACEVTFPIKS